VSAFNHPATRKTLAALGGTAAVVAVCLIAGAVSRLAGGGTGVAVIVATFAGCWIVFSPRPRRHPATPRRRSRGRDPQITVTESQEPAQLAA